ELPVLVAHVLELRHGVDQPGVVHADVDRPEVTLDPAHDVLDLRRLADVTRVAASAPARRLDLAGGAHGAVAVEVEDRDRAALGASSPSSTASMMSLVAIGGRLAIIRASAFASFKVSPSFVSLLARPSARHSGAGTCVPRMRNSSALVRPMRRGIRCEPPKPG